jgi:alcohol dehydrogenase YqhD (iron-dependent ADH family)
MENFIAFNPTKVHFGRNVLDTLGKEASAYGKKALLMHGKGSALMNGSYPRVIDQLSAYSIEVVEYNGIKSNPVITDVDKAAQKGIASAADMVVAIGGGSVIDSAKITAICMAQKCKGWDVMDNSVRVSSSVPLIAVLTLAATGTEMNSIAVLQNTETREKFGFSDPVMFPKHSFLDPTYTLTVPASYTSYGIADLIAHSLENFFGNGDASLSDRFVEGIIREAMHYGPLLLTDLHNYDLRARIMWAATNALNGLTGYGRSTGDWGVHALGHILSFLYDTPHGATLTIAYPAWLRHIRRKDPGRIEQLGRYLFDNPDVSEVISNIETFFSSINCPVRLREIGITREHKNELMSLMNRNKASGRNYFLNDTDRMEIVEMMF